MNSHYSQNDVTLPFHYPLNLASVGRLVLPGGAANLTIRADATLPSLCRAHFEGVIPEVTGDGAGSLQIGYPRFGLLSWFYYAWEETRAEIVLNGRIPWEITVRGGLAKLDADLRELQLRQFDVDGGISKGFLRLSRPVGQVPLRIGGGASKVVISRPEGTAVRCRVRGGTAGLTFDDRYFGAIGGETSFETCDFPNSSDRFTLDVAGGASKLTLETWSAVGAGWLKTVPGYEIVAG